MSLQQSLQNKKFDHFEVSFPAEHILLLTIDRQKALNCINQATSREIASIWSQFDQDASLWIGIITGKGRAFCTGADLKGVCNRAAAVALQLILTEWDEMNRAGIVNDMAAPGLAGLPRRSGKKPIIAAVNGITMGGGFEMVANCDLVVAAASATFALPEAKRGIVPVAGCLPRLTRTLGLQRTMDLVLTGRSVSAKTLEDWGLISQVVDGDVVAAAVKLAQQVCQNSPDALIVGRLGVRMSWEMASAEEAVTVLARDWYPQLMAGANFREGIEAFVQKREVRWVDSKL